MGEIPNLGEIPSDACGLPSEYRDVPRMPAILMCLLEELHIARCGKEGKCMAATVVWPVLWVTWLTADAQLEAEAKVGKLEEELRLEKNMRCQLLCWLWGWQTGGEQGSNLETFVCCFAKLGGHK